MAEKRESNYEGFQALNNVAKAQKQDVLDVKTGGYEVVSHTLYKRLLPEFRERHGAVKARNMLSVLGYLHASKVGDSASLDIPIELRGWAIMKRSSIAKGLGMSEDTLGPVMDALIEERLLVVKKAPYRGNMKNYYLPLYYPWDGDLSGEMAGDT